MAPKIKIVKYKYSFLLAALIACQSGLTQQSPSTTLPSTILPSTTLPSTIPPSTTPPSTTPPSTTSPAAPSSFAIIIDEETFSHTRKAVMAYKDMLEKKEHLATFIISNNWKHPEEIRAILQKLAKGAPALEGAVLVGRIPVPMIRNAQHMTSAFKMDETKFPLERSSVASDRFYDDFDLRFRFLEQDKKRPLWFYMELDEASPQAINSDIYTARIISHKPGEQAYIDISNFLEKAVEARNKPGRLNRILAFTGGGYNSESLTAWSNEQQLLRECFPLAFTTAGSNNVLNFRMDTAMKQVLMSELQRPALDLAFLSEHGDIEKQYITNESAGKILTSEIGTIRPAARMVVFNACYNGSFHHPDNIAGAYLFNDGGTVVTQGNTVNVLQDKYAFRLAGLLQEGVRVGIWNSCINSLETHLLGDPTWRFHQQSGDNINTELVTHWKSEKFWQSRLRHPSPAQRALALSRLAALHANNSDWSNNASHSRIASLSGNKRKKSAHPAAADKLSKVTRSDAVKPGTEELQGINDLSNKIHQPNSISQLALTVFDTANAVNERMQCLALLAAQGGYAFNKVASRALLDPHEYIRRKAAEWIAKSGDDAFIPQLVSLILSHPNDERVIWSAKRTLSVMNAAKVKQEIRQQVGEAAYLLNKEALLTNWLQEVEQDSLTAAKTYTAIIDKQLPEAKRIQAIRLLRNNNYHECIPQLVSIMLDNTESAAVRTQLLEAVGWFSNTYHKTLLLQTCCTLAADKNIPQEISREAQQTARRLTQWQLL